MKKKITSWATKAKKLADVWGLSALEWRTIGIHSLIAALSILGLVMLWKIGPVTVKYFYNHSKLVFTLQRTEMSLKDSEEKRRKEKKNFRLNLQEARAKEAGSYARQLTAEQKKESLLQDLEDQKGTSNSLSEDNQRLKEEVKKAQTGTTECQRSLAQTEKTLAETQRGLAEIEELRQSLQTANQKVEALQTSVEEANRSKGISDKRLREHRATEQVLLKNAGLSPDLANY